MMFYRQKTKSGTAGKRATLMTLALMMTSLCVGSVSSIFASPAHAATEGVFRTKIVRYGDLDLASEKGREALDRRIRRAAKAVCGTGGSLPVVRYSKTKACQEAAHRNAWAIAQQRIDSHRLAMRITN